MCKKPEDCVGRHHRIPFSPSSSWAPVTYNSELNSHFLRRGWTRTCLSRCMPSSNLIMCFGQSNESELRKQSDSSVACSPAAQSSRVTFIMHYDSRCSVEKGPQAPSDPISQRRGGLNVRAERRRHRLLTVQTGLGLGTHLQPEGTPGQRSPEFALMSPCVT